MAENNTGDFNEEKESAEAEAKLEAEKDKREEEKKDEKEKDEKEEFDEKEEPPTRRSVQDYIIERKNKKIAKLEKKEKEREEPEETEEESPFSKEDEEAIGKVVNKRTKPLEDVLKAQSDKNDMDTLKIKYEVSNAMEKRVAKYRDHSAYQNIPTENIYLMLAGQKSVLQAKKEALKTEDKENQTGGHTSRKGEKGLPDFRKMSGKEFDEYDKNSGGQF